MKKLFKLFLKLALVLVLLLAAGVITLKVMFPPEKLKSMALSYAQNTLHREITFDDISLNLVGVTLDNFALSEGPTFKQGTFAKANKLVVKIALKPLFEKRIEIDTISLDGLDVKIIKHQNGSFNFDSLINALAAPAAAPKAAAAPTAPSAPFDLMADKISITNCQFSYADLQTGTTAAIKNLNIQIGNFDFNDPFSLSVHFTTAYKDASGVAVLLPVKVEAVTSLSGLDMSKAYATIKNIGLSYKTIKLNLWGEVKNFEKPHASLSGKISGISNQTFVDFLPKLPVFALPEINLNAKLSADIAKSSAVIDTFNLSIMDSVLTASGSANWGAKEVVYNASASLKLMLGQISQITAMLDSYGLDGQVKGSMTASSKNQGKDLRGQIALENVTLKYDPIVVSSLNGLIRILSLENIECDALKGLLNKEVFTANFSYLTVRDVMNLVFNLDLAKLTLSRFPASSGQSVSTSEAQAQPAVPSASAKAQSVLNLQANIKVGPIEVPYFMADGFTLNAHVDGVSSSMTNANGTVDFTLQPGAIKDLDSFVKESKIVKIILLPISIVNKVALALNIELFPQENPQDKGKIKYSSAQGAYTFTNGLMRINTTHFASKLTNLNANGTADFKNGDLDMRVSATVLTSQTPIVIKIGGTMENPKGKLDVLNTVGSLVGGLLNYKTPGKVIAGTADVAGSVVRGTTTTTGKVAETAVKTGVDVTKTVANVGVDTVKGTYHIGKNTLKGIGALFKKETQTQEKNSSTAH